MGRTSSRAWAVVVVACGAVPGDGDVKREVLVGDGAAIGVSAGSNDPVLWCRHTNATLAEWGSDIIINGTNIYAVGLYGPSSYGSGIIVSKWAANGAHAWTSYLDQLNTSLPLDGMEWGREVWCNGSSDVYISGTGTALAKVNSTGHIISLNVSSYDRLTDIDVTNGFIYSGGGMESGTFSTHNEGYLKKFWLNGSLVWQQVYQAVPSYDAGVRDVKIDGDVIRGLQTRTNSSLQISYLLSWNATTGAMLSNVSLGRFQAYEMTILDSACYFVGENYSGIVGKAWLNGSIAWVYKMTPPQGDASTYMRDVSIHDGHLYACGFKTHQDARGAEGLVGKWTLDGVQLWNYTWDAPGDDYAEGIAADATGVYVTGLRADTGPDDLFVMKLRLDGKVPVPAIGKNVTGSVLSGRDIQFTASGTTGDGSPAWLWDFGDGTTSALQNPVHVYTAGGAYMVSLNVTDMDGSSAVATTAIDVVQDLAPSVVIAASNTTPWTGAAVTFNCTGTHGNGPATFLWTFGAGGATSTQQNTTFAFVAAGTYNVTHAVTDADGDVDVAWVIVVVTDQLGSPPGGLDPGATAMVVAGVAAAGVVVAGGLARQRRLQRARRRNTVS